MSHPDLEIGLLRAFVAVAETGSFTGAGDAVSRSQSAVSQKIIRLEKLLGRRVFNRSSRSLSLTGDGERLLVAARRILEANEIAVRALLTAPAIGTVRLGISEDFVPGLLPRMLSRFRRIHPHLRLELMTGLSCHLLAAYDDGRLDAVIAKKDGRAQRGRVIWRDQLVWLCADGMEVDFAAPLPLVLLPAPCTYRELMIETLDSVRQEWFASCTAASLAGVEAAIAGGFGVSILGRSFVDRRMRVLRVPGHWPALPMTEIVVLGEHREAADLVRPIVTFLTESLNRAVGDAAQAADVLAP